MQMLMIYSLMKSENEIASRVKQSGSKYTLQPKKNGMEYVFVVQQQQCKDWVWSLVWFDIWNYFGKYDESGGDDDFYDCLDQF